MTDKVGITLEEIFNFLAYPVKSVVSDLIEDDLRILSCGGIPGMSFLVKDYKFTEVSPVRKLSGWVEFEIRIGTGTEMIVVSFVASFLSILGK